MEIDKIVAASKRRQKKHWYFRNLEHLYHRAVTEFENNWWIQETLFDISAHRRTILLNRMSRILNYDFVCLENNYSQNDQPNAFAFGLKPNLGFLTVPSHSNCVSWLIHEMAHCLTGSLVLLRTNQQEFESHHGPIFQNYLCHCYSLITEYDLEYFVSVARAYPNFELLSPEHMDMLLEHYTNG